MVFYVIACSTSPPQEEADIERFVDSCISQGGRAIGTKDNVEIDKTRFKVGTLDSLMELNETLVKVDQTLDSTTKKIEKLANEMYAKELKIVLQNDQIIDVLDYIKNFKWDDTKYHRGRSLVELAGVITEKMKTIDNDIKKQQDELNEVKNTFAQMSKKEGTTLLTKDLAEVIYSATNIDPDKHFVEKKGSKILTTVIAVVHKTKIQQFMSTYETLIPDFGAVPRSAVPLNIDDQEGNQLYRFAVFTENVDQYLIEARKANLNCRKFAYDYEKYKLDLEEKTKLDQKNQYLKNNLAHRSYYAFSELFIALMHLKVMRAFIDGVLRFGIPPKFYIGIVRPNKGMEKVILQKLNEKFEDPTMKAMYGSKEDANDTEDFFSFVNIPLTSPLFLQ